MNWWKGKRKKLFNLSNGGSDTTCTLERNATSFLNPLNGRSTSPLIPLNSGASPLNPFDDKSGTSPQSSFDNRRSVSLLNPFDSGNGTSPLNPFDNTNNTSHQRPLDSRNGTSPLNPFDSITSSLCPVTIVKGSREMVQQKLSIIEEYVSYIIPM